MMTQRRKSSSDIIESIYNFLKPFALNCHSFANLSIKNSVSAKNKMKDEIPHDLTWKRDNFTNSVLITKN